MRQTAPIETLNYYTLIISKLMRRPMSGSERYAVARHVEAKLPEAALHDLRGEQGMIAALDSIETLLREPRLLRRPRVAIHANIPSGGRSPS